MIGTEIQNHGCFGPQAANRLKLKAGEFQDIEFICLIQQFQHRRTKISSNTGAETCNFGHLSQQRRHRTLAIGAGNCYDWHADLAQKQLDITNHLDAP